MKEIMPRTPFSTALSGSAKETELRLKNIFSGPKKRPPALFLAAVFAVCIFCGNLVSCNVAQPETGGDPARLDNARSGDVSLDLTEHESAWVTYMRREPNSEEELKLLETLFRAAERANGYQFQTPTAQLLDSIEKDGWVLGAVFVEDHLENTLILGIMDKETGEVSHGVFQRSYHAGVPNVVTFQGQDGAYRLLYTFNGQENGQLDGQAGLVRLDGEFMAWEWPVEGDVRYGHEPPGAAPAAYPEYQEYWYSHLALLAPGGVDVYTVNPEYVWGGDEPMWQLDHNETFWYNSSSAEELPMPIYFQSLRWLNEHTEPEAGWRITSLILDKEKCDTEKRLDCFTLWAHTDDGRNELVMDLYFPYEQTGNRRSYGSLDHAAYSNGEEQDSNHPDKQDKPNAAPASSQPDKQDKDDWDWDDALWDAKEAAQLAAYQSVGVTMSGKDYYYQGQLVNVFLDQQPNKAFYTLNRNPTGTVNVKILRGEDGTVTGAAYMTDAEAAQFFED